MARNQGVLLVTPVGRMVQGDCFEGSDKDQFGKLRTDKQGQPKIQFFVGLAIAKTDPTWAPFWAAVVAKAQADFPGGEWQLPHFAWKVVDGDQPKYATRDGFPGHYILRLTSGFAPRVVDSQPVPQQIVNPLEVQRGCYLQVQVNVVGNDDTAKPGVYLNLGLTMRVGFGPLIVGGPPAEEVFAQRGQLPPGASATPVGPVPVGAVPGQPAPGALIPGPPAPTNPLPTTGYPAPLAPTPPIAGAPVPTPGYLATGVPGAPAGGVPAVLPLTPGQPVPGAVVPSTGFVQPPPPPGGDVPL